MGRYTVHLVGESNFQSEVSRLSPGTPTTLVPEPLNEHDPRAVKATTLAGETIGYVERESWLTRAMLDDRTPVASRVMEIIGGDAARPSRGVVLEVLTGPEASAALARSPTTSGATQATATATTKMPTWLIVVLVVIGAIIVASIAAPPPKPTEQQAASQHGAVVTTTGSTLSATPTPSEAPAEPSKWAYSTDQDKVRGGTTYYATTSSTNSVRQDFPYSSDTTMDLAVRKSPAHGTDVILTVSSGQLMCSSFQACRGTVSFDGGPAQSVSFIGAADNSSETIFVQGAQSFIGKLKKAKHVVIEKTLYQAGNPQFEFDVAGLKWEH